MVLKFSGKFHRDKEFDFLTLTLQQRDFHAQLFMSDRRHRTIVTAPKTTCKGILLQSQFTEAPTTLDGGAVGESLRVPVWVEPRRQSIQMSAEYTATAGPDSPSGVSPWRDASRPTRRRIRGRDFSLAQPYTRGRTF